MQLSSVSVRDVDVETQVVFPQAVPGSASTAAYGYVVLRRQSGGAYHRVGLVATADGRLLIRGQTSSGSTYFDVNTGLPFVPGTAYKLRVQVEGAAPTTVRAMAWVAGIEQPSTWTVVGTTTANPQIAGSVGLRTLNTSSSGTTVRIDDFVATALGQ